MDHLTETSGKKSITKAIAPIKTMALIAAISLITVLVVTLFGNIGFEDESIAFIVMLAAAAAGVAILVISFHNFPLALNILILLVPLQYVDLAGGRVGFYLSPIRLLLPLMVTAWLFYRSRRPFSPEMVKPNKFLLYPLAGYLIMVCVSVVFSSDKLVGIRSMIRLAESLAIFVMIVDVVRTKKQLEPLLIATSMAVGLISLSLVFQFILSPGEFLASASRSNYNVTSRAESILGQPNKAANTIAILFPILIYSATFSTSRLSKWVLRGFVFLSPLGVLLTASRGGLLGLITGVLTMFRHRIGRIALLSILAIILLISSPLFDFWLNTIENRADSTGDRLDIIRIGLKASLEYPLFGTGFGTFTLLPEYVDFDFPNNVLQAPGIMRDAHNLFLELLVETGVISLLFFGLFLWRMIRLLWNVNNQLYQLKSIKLWWLTQALMGAGLAFFVTRIITADFFVLPVWILIGIMVSGSTIIAGELEVKRKEQISNEKYKVGELGPQSTVQLNDSIQSQ